MAASALVAQEERSDFYVYVHRRATDGAVFYVGKGCGDRARSKKQRNSAWQAVVAEHGYTIEIISCRLTSREALDAEEHLIRHYGLAVLSNVRARGCLRQSHVPEERRQRISAALRGRTHSPTSRYFKGFNSWLNNGGRDYLREQVKNIPQGPGARAPHAVVCVEVGLHFGTIKEAVEWLRPSNPRAQHGNISKCCMNLRERAYGYRWRYAD